MKKPFILVVNPGSTTTKTALFEGTDRLLQESLDCPPEERVRLGSVLNQVPMRTDRVFDFLKRNDIDPDRLDAVSARGGPFRPIPGGVYPVNEAMLADARDESFVEHPSKIACIIADALARPRGIPAYIVDAVCTDEYDDISRISGHPDVPRKSLTHALNMKSVARLYAREVGCPYEELNLITAQLGGGITMAVHHRGRMIDSADTNGEGPFSPQRSGGLRVDGLAKLALGSGMDFKSFRRMLTTECGLMAHLGTSDCREVQRRIDAGDEHARLIFSAMACSVAKHICALAAPVCGKVDAVLLTGGLAHSEAFTGMVSERVSFLAPVKVYPGEREMEALAEGAVAALTGQCTVRDYPTGERL